MPAFLPLTKLNVNEMLPDVLPGQNEEPGQRAYGRARPEDTLSADILSLHQKLDNLKSRFHDFEESQQKMQHDVSESIAHLATQMETILERLSMPPSTSLPGSATSRSPPNPCLQAQAPQSTWSPMLRSAPSNALKAPPPLAADSVDDNAELSVGKHRSMMPYEASPENDDIMAPVERCLELGIQRLKKSTDINATAVLSINATLRWVQNALPDVRDRVHSFLPMRSVPVRDLELRSEILRQRAIDEAAEDLARTDVSKVHAGNPSRFMVSMEQFTKFKRYQSWMRYGLGIGPDSWDVSFMSDLQHRLQHIGTGLFSSAVHMRLVTARMPVLKDTHKYDESPQYGEPQHQRTWCHVAPPNASLSPLRYEGHYCVDHVESFRVFISPRPPEGNKILPWYCPAGGLHAQDLTTTTAMEYSKAAL